MADESDNNGLELRLDRAFVLEKCRSFIDFQMWPAELDNRLEPWLENFLPEEMEFALHLLNSLLFFSERMVQQLFLAAFHNLSALHRQDGRAFLAERLAWQQFFDRLIVTYVTGEHPSPADSGFIFARMARDLLGLDEQGQIATPEETLRQLALGANRPVVFVDDFVGSGNQFITTWRRRYDIGQVYDFSFERYAARRGPGNFFYCPALCTTYGAENIAGKCPQVRISPGNLIPKNYSALDDHSIIWPAKMRAAGAAFVETASRRAGIPDTNGGEDDWRGLHKLGLCIAFHHSVPDATLPLYTWDQNRWSPLLRQR